MTAPLFAQHEATPGVAVPGVPGLLLPKLIPIGSFSPPPPPDDGGNPIDNNNETKLGLGQAERIATRLEGADILCGAIQRAYRVDCLANQYERIAKTMPKGGEYKEIRRAFLSAADNLAAIAATNVDTGASRIRPRVSSGPIKPKATRPLNAVLPSRQSQAEAQAAVVIDQLSTVLLRSGENSAKRQIHFAKIAQAVDSNKVLLRSAKLFPLDYIERRHFG